MDQPPPVELNEEKSQKTWMIIAAVGVFNLSIGYFFGHRYRVKQTT